MIKLSFIELFFRLIPESFILILAGYAFSGKDIDKVNFCISSLLVAIATFLVRMLPIHFGVHTIILLIIYVLISVIINKLDVIKSISSGLIASTILFMCEWINVFILGIFKFNTETMFKDPTKKILYGIPSLILFSFIIVLIYYKNLYLRKVDRNVFNRETIK